MRRGPRAAAAPARGGDLDAYSDFRDELPAGAAAAEHWLRDRERALGHRDPGMGIELDLSDLEHWTVLTSYAPWSINVEPVGEANLDLGGFHDCGYSIVATLTASEAHQLMDTLTGIAPVLPLEEFHARRRAERDARHAERRRQRRAKSRALLRRR